MLGVNFMLIEGHNLYQCLQKWEIKWEDLSLDETYLSEKSCAKIYSINFEQLSGYCFCSFYNPGIFFVTMAQWCSNPSSQSIFRQTLPAVLKENHGLNDMMHIKHLYFHRWKRHWPVSKCGHVSCVQRKHTFSPSPSTIQSGPWILFFF